MPKSAAGLVVAPLEMDGDGQSIDIVDAPIILGFQNKLGRHRSSEGIAMRNLPLVVVLIAVAATLFLAPSPAGATVVVQGYWPLGEPGTYDTVDNSPNDMSGNGRNIPIKNASAMIPVAGGVDWRAALVGSTHYYNDTTDATGSGGYYGSSVTYDPPEDNVGIEVFVKLISSADLSGTRTIFSTDGDTSGLKLQVSDGGLRASYPGVGVVGSVFTPEIGRWHHLALVRDNGVGTFYVDGVPLGPTSASTPINSSVFGDHFGVNPGGAAGFRGFLDSLRLFTFNPGEFNPRMDLQGYMPEPSAVVLLVSLAGAGLLGFAVKRVGRRRQA